MLARSLEQVFASRRVAGSVRRLRGREVNELAAELVRECGIAAHPLLLFCTLRSQFSLKPLGTWRPGPARSGGTPYSVLQAALHRNSQNDASPDLPRHRNCALAHKSDKLAIRLLGDDSKGPIGHRLRPQPKPDAFVGPTRIGRPSEKSAPA